jgi:ribonuclease D
MVNSSPLTYTLIEDASAFLAFYEANKSVDWVAIDTEFIGEKRFYTLLCLVQVASPQGFYLIDTFKCNDLTPLLKLITDPSILKITHAGENDYRLLHSLFGCIPQNVIDIQVAAGFLGYGYPISFQKLLERELRVSIDKSFGVTDWDSRPLQKKQLMYALNDVIYLKDLWQQMSKKLQKHNRLDWVFAEMYKWTSIEAYTENPYKEFYNNKVVHYISTQEQAFLLRLLQWRVREAQRTDYSKEMILADKHLNIIVKYMRSGKQALLQNRLITPNVIEKHWIMLQETYQKPVTDAEKLIIQNIPDPVEDDTEADFTMNFLDILVEHQCERNGVAPQLVIPKSVMKKMRAKKEFFDESIAIGWKQTLLGDTLIDWLRRRNNLDVKLEADTCVFKMP